MKNYLLMCADTYLILLTSNSGEARKAEGYAAGADAYLTKPLRSDASCLDRFVSRAAPLKRAARCLRTRLSRDSRRRMILRIVFTGLAVRVSVLVGHGGHVVGSRPAKRGHDLVVGGDKIPDGDAHGAFAQELAGRIVVRCGNF